MDIVDPRCYAPVGLAADAHGTITAVPFHGGLVRAGSTDRRGRPYWAITFRVCEGDALGAHLELRLWPESNSEWFARQLERLTETDVEALAHLDAEARWELLARELARRSYRASYETTTDGRAEVRFLDGSCPLLVPANLPEPARPRATPPEPDAAEAALPRLRYEVARSPAEVRELCRQLEPCAVLGVDIETDCGPLGSPPEWTPRDGAIRLVQVAGEVGGERACGIVDCYEATPIPLVRLLASGARIVAHNARYEQAWLTFHYGLPLWRDVLDTSCAFRLFERLWSLQDPAYERRDATLGTVTRRMLGAAKGDHGADWWGAPALSTAQLDYAAYDALAMLDLYAPVLRIAESFGNLEQVRAASRTAVREALRLPSYDERAWEVACELIDREGVGAAAVIRRLPLTAAQRAGLRERVRLRG